MLPPFYRDTTFFLIPYDRNNDNPCYNDTFRKERELSLLPSSTVCLKDQTHQIEELHGRTEMDIFFQSNFILPQNSYQYSRAKIKISHQTDANSLRCKRIAVKICTFSEQSVRPTQKKNKNTHSRFITHKSW